MPEITVEIIVGPDGGLLVERGTKEQNDLLLKILGDNIKDPESLNYFISMTENVEIIDGDTILCG